ncbi:MAG: hypothetical protein II777_09930, partial [Clostridia bacterium]|nr:hypothetical protein [Clostridia bacterium]
HETYYGEKSLVGMTDITVDFYLFVPDHLEYGEVHLYLNILENKTKTVSEYDKDPFIEVCVGFAQKYRCVRTSYGDKAPMTGHEELLRAVIDYDMHDYIYSCVENLYNLNENLGPNIVAERRAVMKEIYTAVLKSYKIENAEEYDRIIEEFRSNEGKIYDRDGNLKDTPIYRHDPLEDMN